MADTKGERTRERIISAAAPIFNRLGYAGATVADLMAATGLEKGGLYRHFASKEDIALASFDHAVRLHGERIRSHIVAAGASAPARLIAVGEAIASIVEDPVIVGGCPLLNTAIESDDAEGPLYPALRTRTRRAMTRLITAVRDIISDGMSRGEFRKGIDADAEASGIVAMLEGSLMLAKLYDDGTHVKYAVDRVRDRADALAASTKSR
ncbi:MAG TPA: TetR/AcrR family transcriptional regulator [Gemmatimonadaceae bacterium]|jgi:AcrR family transcriptional regulator